MRRLQGKYKVTEFWADWDVTFSLEKGDMLGQMQNLIIRPTGQYSTLDPNNLGNLPNVMGQALTGAVAENIRGENPTADRCGRHRGHRQPGKRRRGPDL